MESVSSFCRFSLCKRRLSRSEQRQTRLAGFPWAIVCVSALGAHTHPNRGGGFPGFHKNCPVFLNCFVHWRCGEFLERMTSRHLCQVAYGKILVNPEIVRTYAKMSVPSAKMASSSLAAQATVREWFVNRSQKTIDGCQDLDTLGPLHHICCGFVGVGHNIWGCRETYQRP